MSMQSSSLAELAQRAGALSAAASWAEACAAWQHVVEHDGHDPLAWSNLGLARAHAGHYPEAIDAFRIAMEHGLPADEVAMGIGIVFCLRQQYDIARENLEMAVAANPDNLIAWSNLVVTYSRLGLAVKTFQAAEKVLAVNPANISALSSLGSLCKDLGMPDEAIGWQLRAAEAAPHDANAISNVLWAMLHADTVSAADILAQACEFDRRAMATSQSIKIMARRADKATPDMGQGHKLRIGWLSADLRNHAVGHFVVPVLERLDHGRFESFVYYNSYISDAISERAVKVATQWHNIAQMSDSQLAACIRNDGIDILVDLGGHTNGSRLQVLAGRPAPVQVTWLGYPGTSGLSAVDYTLVPPDPVLLAGGWCSETPIALPDCYGARDALYIPAASSYAAPFEKNGHVTFGCLNNFAKVSPSAIKTWASILYEVPDTRLLMVVNRSDENFAAEVASRFAEHGTNASRLIIRNRMNAQEYFATYREIDVGLDTFPFNGGTTGFDSLSMSTPFITLAGQALHSRLGANLLRAVALDDLIANTPSEYCAKAIALAQDKVRLAALHRNLRRQVEASSLMDVENFARGIEAAFTSMHEATCRKTAS